MLAGFGGDDASRMVSEQLSLRTREGGAEAEAQSEDNGGDSARRPPSPAGGVIVTLNVGGTLFTTSTKTLAGSSVSGRLWTLSTAIEQYRGRERMHAHSDFLRPQEGTGSRAESLEDLRSALSSVGAVPVAEADPLVGELDDGRSEAFEWVLFMDRNPNAFPAVLDYLRTSKQLLPPAVSQQMMEEEMKYYGLSTAGMRLKESAHHTLGFMYGQQIASFVALCNERLQRGGLQGRLRVSVGLIAMPYGIGIDKLDSEDACRQLSSEFDYAEVSDDLVSILGIRECMWEVSRQLLLDGFFSTGGYSPGDIYGHLVPVHIWFVSGVDKQLVDQAAIDLQRKLSTWRPIELPSKVAAAEAAAAAQQRA